MSQLNVDDIYNNAGTGGVNLPAGVKITGVTTFLGSQSEVNVSGVSTFTGHVSTGSTVGAAGSIYFPDNKGINFGNAAEGDLSIFHDGSDSYINDTGTGDFYLQSNKLKVNNAAGTETMAIFNENGDVQLFSDGTARFQTTNTGAVVTGILTATGDIETTGGNLTVGLGKSINICLLYTSDACRRRG